MEYHISVKVREQTVLLTTVDKYGHDGKEKESRLSFTTLLSP